MKTYLAELRTQLQGFAQSLRARRLHGDQLQAEISLDIVADVEVTSARAARHAYSAQQAELEAERIFRAAQIADSPGGRVITPAEAAPAFRHLRNCHRHTHAVCQLLAQ